IGLATAVTAEVQAVVALFACLHDAVTAVRVPATRRATTPVIAVLVVRAFVALLWPVAHAVATTGRWLAVKAARLAITAVLCAFVAHLLIGGVGEGVAAIGTPLAGVFAAVVAAVIVAGAVVALLEGGLQVAVTALWWIEAARRAGVATACRVGAHVHAVVALLQAVLDAVAAEGDRRAIVVALTVFVLAFWCIGRAIVAHLTADDFSVSALGCTVGARRQEAG